MKKGTRSFIAHLLIAPVVCLLWMADDPPAQAAGNENHCFTCHTNARKLIQITREIAKGRTSQAKATIKSEGEG